MSTRTRNPRLVAGAALTLAGALLLGACGGSADGGATDASEAPSSDEADGLLPPAEGNVTYPLTITTAAGEIVIDERPERIALGDNWDIEMVAALGVTPVGGDEYIELLPWALDVLPHEVETTWAAPTDENYPAEAIAETEPDLILATSAPTPGNYDALSEIAPVLGQPTESAPTPSWQDRLTLIAEALDLSDRAEQVIADHEAYFEDVRAQYPQFAGKTAAFIAFWGGQWGGGYISSAGSGADTFFTDLGFDHNPDGDRFVEDYTMSDELMGEIEGDLFIVGDFTGGSPEEFREFVDNPLFQGLDAVQQGRLIEITTGNDEVVYEGEAIPFPGHFGWALNGTGPLAEQKMSEVLTPIIAGVFE